MGSYLTGLFVAGAVIAAMLGLLSFTQEGQTKSRVDLVAQSNPDELFATAANAEGDEQLEAILLLGDKPGKVDETVRLLAKLLLSHRRALVRTAAGISLKNIGEAALPTLKEMIDLDDGEPLSEACAAVREIGPPGKVFMPRLKQLLESDNYQVQRRGLFALQGIGPASIELLDEVIACLDMDQEILREYPDSFNNQLMACRVLEQLRADALPAEPVLLRILKEGNPSAKSYAALVLGSIGPTDKTDTARLLAEQLDAPLQIQKQRTLLGIAYMGPEASKIEDQVRATMLDTNKHVMPHAAYALWKITGKADEPLKTLMSLLDSPNYRDDAIEFLGKMQGSAAPAVGKLCDQLTSEEDGTVELAVVAIGNIGPASSSALGELRALLNNKDALIRYQVRESIKQIETHPEGE